MYDFHSKKARILALIMCLALLLPFCFALGVSAEDEAPAETVLHVKTGGTGDGKSADSPLGDIGKAFKALSECGGRIVVYGKYELASSSLHDETWGAFVEPKHAKKITVSGSDAFLVCKENYRYYMSGETQFENIGISGSGAFLIAARFNPLTMGDGINIIGFSDGVYLIGGFNGSNSGLTEEALSFDSRIEVRSGTYKYICGYNKGTANKDCTGDAEIIIGGGSVNCVCAGISTLNSAFTDNGMNRLTVRVSGGDVYKICDTDMALYGSLGYLALEYTGGNIEHVIIAEDTEATAVFTDEMSEKISGFIRFFDTYKQGDSEVSPTRKIKVACIGDSITGGLGSNGSSADTYPAKLGEMLGSSYEVCNFSEGGKTMLASGGSAYKDSEAYAKSVEYLPDVVLIMLGSNDLEYLVSDAGAKDALYTDALSLLESYAALESNPVIYLLTPTQRTDDRALDLALRDILLPLYKMLAEDTKVGFVDVYTISQSMKDHFPNSIHPDATAAAFIATHLYSAVVSNSSVSEIKRDPVPVEIVIKTESEPAPIPDTPASPVTDDEASGDSSSFVFIVLILFVLAEAVIFTYIAVKKRNGEDPFAILYPIIAKFKPESAVEADSKSKGKESNNNSGKKNSNGKKKGKKKKK